jgi:hypothetical protein
MVMRMRIELRAINPDTTLHNFFQHGPAFGIQNGMHINHHVCSVHDLLLSLQ